jgi:hypothetical protein
MLGLTHSYLFFFSMVLDFSKEIFISLIYVGLVWRLLSFKS